MLFLHLQYLALQFFNIGISFCSFSLACSSYFSFLLSKRKATPLVTAIAVMVAVFQNLSMRISDFTSLDSCSARFTGYTFCNFAAFMRCKTAFCVSMIKLFRSRCSLPVTAFDGPCSISKI